MALFSIKKIVVINKTRRCCFIRKPVKGHQTELVNDEIPNIELLLIDDEGNNLGTLPRNEALQKAYDKELDLVVINPSADKLVAKIMDYRKFKFDQSKKLKEMKKNQHVVQVKEIRLGHNIDKHDFETKLRHAQGFIEKGNKVKITMRLSGRMIAHKDVGMEVVNRFITELGDKVIVESQPKLEGRNIQSLVSPQK